MEIDIAIPSRIHIICDNYRADISSTCRWPTSLFPLKWTQLLYSFYYPLWSHLFCWLISWNNGNQARQTSNLLIHWLKKLGTVLVVTQYDSLLCSSLDLFIQIMGFQISYSWRRMPVEELCNRDHNFLWNAYLISITSRFAQVCAFFLISPLTIKGLKGETVKNI